MTSLTSGRSGSDTNAARCVALVTNCTNRKRGQADPALHVRNLPNKSLHDAASVWCDRVQKATPTTPAVQVYCGRAMNEALAAVSSLGTRLRIVSAGLGLIEGSTPIPVYDLTVSGTSNSNVIRHCGLDVNSASDWWTELNDAQGIRNPIAAAIRRSTSSLTVLAVSNSYLRMLSKDLAELTSEDLRKVRIVTHFNPIIEERFGKCLMPYTSKFDGPGSPNAGTKADFAQRAAFHFFTEVLTQTPDGDIETHWGEVNKRIAILPEPQKFKRQRLTDDQIIDLIRRFWRDTDGQSSRMLRLLRDREQIACEQGRFKSLFTQVAEEVGQTHG